MGFGDKLGDAFDVFRDAGANALGVAMDYAKATAAMAEDPSWGNQRRQSAQVRSSFGSRKDTMLSEHKTVAAIGKAVLATADGGLRALGYPSHKVMRGLSTYAQYVGSRSGTYEGDERNLSLGEAWDNSKRTSFGQAVAVTSGMGPKDADYSNAWEFGAKGDDSFSSRFSFATGAIDAITSLATDPLILVGKAAKVAQIARKELRASDVAGLEKAGTGAKLTRRQRKVVKEHENVLDALDGLDETGIYALLRTKDINNVAGLSAVLGAAKGERHTQGLILMASMGSREATATLRAQRADLMDMIDRLNKDLDDELIPRHLRTPDKQGLFDFELAN